MLGLDGATGTSVGMLRNNLAYSNNGHTLLSNMTNGGPISDEYNSWDPSLNVTVTVADFQSVTFAPPASCQAPYSAGGTVCVPPTDTTSFAGMASARNADGSLPVLPFLRLAATSHLIDKGTNVGLPYSGAGPDLGCFESGLVFDPSDGGTSSSSGGATSGSIGTGDSGVGDDAGAGSRSSTGGSSSSASSSGSGSSAASSSGSEGAGGPEGGLPGSVSPGKTPGAAGDKSGCGCESVGVRHLPPRGLWASVGLVLACLALGRGRRARRRSKPW